MFNIAHYIKEDYLIEKIKPIDVKKILNISNLLSALKHCGFQGRNLGKALDILEKMVTDEDCLTILTLSGAMVPAGMGDLICVLMEHEIIDVLISTGANIIHDLVDGFTDVGHYVESPKVDYNDLFNEQINRICDTFLPDDNMLKIEKNILEIKKKLQSKNKFLESY